MNPSAAIAITIPGWGIASLVNSCIVSDVASTVGVVVTCSWLWSCVGNSFQMIRFARCGAIVLCFLQNFAWLFTSVKHHLDSSLDISETLNETMFGGLVISDYAAAVLYCSIFCFALAFFGSLRFVKSLERKLDQVLGALKLLSTKSLLPVIISLLMAEAFLVSTGIVGTRTIKVDGFEDGEMPVWYFLVSSMTSLQLLLNGLLLWKTVEAKNRSSRLFLGGILACSILVVLFLYFNQGRRDLAFCAFAHFWWAVYFFGNRPGFIKALAAVAICLPLLYYSMLFNNFMRSGHAGLDNYRVSAIEAIPGALKKFVMDPAMRELEQERTSNNLSSRPLVATPLAYCIRLPAEKKAYLLHKDLFHSFIWSIPGPLFPWKENFPNQEDLLYQSFAIGDKDTADSIVLSAYASFGWFGVITHSLFISSLIAGTVFAVMYTKTPPIGTALVCAPILQLITVDLAEESTTSFFNFARSAIFFVVVLWMLDAILRRMGRSSAKLIAIKQNSRFGPRCTR
ncbi:hypothetical protein [Crateriforma spongiae]|uniref:hypothetical protein n=1 Tax=Crateriforma spongiae TaxID=2724528 RepID=UPI001445BCEC|nr:hypothetical protein [Crateriforma spongiae]